MITAKLKRMTSHLGRKVTSVMMIQVSDLPNSVNTAQGDQTDQYQYLFGKPLIPSDFFSEMPPNLREAGHV